MKAISFSAQEILAALLDRTKTQTIRPAWKNLDITVTEVGGKKSKPINSETQPRFKVGETVQVMWKQRTSPKGSWFYNHNGSLADQGTMLKHNEELDIFLKEGDYVKLWREGKIRYCFPKILGTVRIMGVFQIEMVQEGSLFNLYRLDWGRKEDPWTNELAKMDGFKNAWEMFIWFDRHYDLSQPKKFWVYRWEWLP